MWTALRTKLKDHTSASDMANKLNNGNISEYVAAASIMQNKAADVPSLSKCTTMRLIHLY